MPASDLALLIAAAEAAGDIARRHFSVGHSVWEKAGGQGPVTEADIEVDDMLRERLMAARPAYGWLSEETEDDTSRLDRKRVFIIDPIDGTRAFTEGHRTWAHSLAVVDQGRPVAAVVYLPMLGKLYTAEAGHGNWPNVAISANVAPLPTMWMMYSFPSGECWKTLTRPEATT